MAIHEVSECEALVGEKGQSNMQKAKMNKQNILCVLFLLVIVTIIDAL